MRFLPHRMRRGVRAGRAIRFVGDSRGSTEIELAVGAVVVLGLVAAGLSVYSRIEAATSAPRIAITMAQYVSQEKVPDGKQLDALASFLRDHELGSDHAVLVVTTAVHKAAGASPAVLWSDRIALGDKAATDEMGRTICKDKSAADENAVFGGHFTMEDEETVFVVDVCTRATVSPLPASWMGDLHHRYLLPTRHPDVTPTAPARTPGGESA